MRKKKIPSKRQLAIILDIPYPHVFRLFHKGYNPTVKTLTFFAKKLNCKVRDLIKE